MPLAASRTGSDESTRSRLAKKVLPTRRSNGILLSGFIRQPKANIGVLGFQRRAQVSEEVRVAGAIGVQEAEHLGIRLAPRLFNRRPVSTVLGERRGARKLERW
jgi:hypothetical protein